MREGNAAASPPCGPPPFPLSRQPRAGGLTSPRQRRGRSASGSGRGREMSPHGPHPHCFFFFLTWSLATPSVFRPCHALLACFSHHFFSFLFFPGFLSEACVGDSVASLLLSIRPVWRKKSRNQQSRRWCWLNYRLLVSPGGIPSARRFFG